MDKLTPERRSDNMRQIKSKGMKPELAVRKLVHRLGYRFRLHSKDLPGKPDLVFRGRRKVIFVHGCFWHQHADPACLDGRAPRSNNDYWGPKLRRNIERDAIAEAALRAAGWDVLAVWECEIQKEGLEAQLVQFLGERTPENKSRHSMPANGILSEPNRHPPLAHYKS